MTATDSPTASASGFSSAKYVDLSRDELIARLAELELHNKNHKGHLAPAESDALSIQDGSPSGGLRSLRKRAAAGLSYTPNESPASAGTTAQQSSTTPKATKANSKPKPAKPFVFSSHPTRHIALLIAYHGWPYSGLAIQPDLGTNGPKAEVNASSSSSLWAKKGRPAEVLTVEGELLKALEKTRLIDAAKGLDGAEYSRCGRTDRGVSGEGQVVNLYVRSLRTDGGERELLGWRPPAEPMPRKVKQEPAAPTDASAEAGGVVPDQTTPTSSATSDPVPSQPLTEMPYARLLNGVLPPSIRIIAWSPVSPAFDSRFSCSYRHYKYIFHPRPSAGMPLLDIVAMHRAAQRLVGEHDFRNFCKLDGSKQIKSHMRGVLRAWFEWEGEGEAPCLSKVSSEGQGRGGEVQVPKGQYVFNLVGTAFLWHQVRHIIASLFLIGAHLEPEHLISDLLDVHRFPAKPSYQMGDPLPLTLHECGYKEEEGLDWRYGPYDGPLASLISATDRESTGVSDSADAQIETNGIDMAEVLQKANDGRDALERQLEAARQEAEVRAWQVQGGLRTMYKVLGPSITGNSQNCNLAGAAGTTSTPGGAGGKGKGKGKEEATLTFYPVGGGDMVVTQRYKPVLERPLGETPDEVNRKWAEKPKAVARRERVERGLLGGTGERRASTASG